MGILGHDLRNPLGTVVHGGGHAGAANPGRSSAPGGARNHLVRVRRAARGGCQEMIDTLLDFTRRPIDGPGSGRFASDWTCRPRGLARGWIEEILVALAGLRHRPGGLTATGAAATGIRRGWSQTDPRTWSPTRSLLRRERVPSAHVVHPKATGTTSTLEGAQRPPSAIAPDETRGACSNRSAAAPTRDRSPRRPRPRPLHRQADRAGWDDGLDRGRVDRRGGHDLHAAPAARATRRAPPLRRSRKRSRSTPRATSSRARQCLP